VAAFPTLAAALSRGEHERFIEHVATAARYVFFWSIPASALILVLRAHIVRVILGSGQFDWTATRLTAAAFALFALSLAAQGLMLLLVRGYYAAGRTFVPFMISAAVAALALILGSGSILALKAQGFRHIVEVFMRVEDLPGSSVLALPAAYAIASIVGAIAMVAHFEYRFGGFVRRVQRSFWESLVAAIAGGYGTHIFLDLVSSFDVSSTVLSIFGQGFAAGVFGLTVICLVYYILGNREYAEVYTSAHSRLWRKGVPAVTAAAPAEESVTK
jgi:putative peptidoglycan lipid II flippase